MKTFHTLLFLIALALYVQAQPSQTTFTGNLDHVKVVVLELTDEVSVRQSNTHDLTVTSNLTAKGRIIGWTADEKRPEFVIEHRQHGDTLFVNTPERWQQKTIGVDLYEEQITSEICIPVDKAVIIPTADRLLIDANFGYLRILKAKQVLWENLDRSSYRIMLCRASEKMVIAGIRHHDSYELTGLGDGLYTIDAERITIR